MNRASFHRASRIWVLSSLLLANLLPLVGVYLWDWNITDLVMLYWLENAVVGLYTVLSMIVASPREQAWWAGLASKLFTVPFFVVHYGVFWVVHGVFLNSFFGQAAPFSPAGGPAAGFIFSSPIMQLTTRTDLFAWPLSLMLVSHGIAFVTNFIGKGEFRAVSAPQMMMRPYGRVVVLHVSIVLGGFLALSVGPSMGVLVLFVLMKIVVDIAAQLREERRVEARTGSEPVNPAVATQVGD